MTKFASKFASVLCVATAVTSPALASDHESSRVKLELGYAATSVGGADSGFKLNGDLDAIDLDAIISVSTNVILSIGYRNDTGHFTRTTGEKTNYSRDSWDANIGYKIPINQNDLVLVPLAGVTRISSSNKVVVGNTLIFSTQKSTRANIGVNLENSSGKLSYSVGGMLEYPLKETQEVVTLNIVQKGKNKLSWNFKTKIAYQLARGSYIGIKPEYRFNRFDDKVGNRKARQKDKSVSVFLGFKI